MVRCFNYSSTVNPIGIIYLRDIERDSLENFLIEDFAEGYILGADPLGKRMSNLEDIRFSTPSDIQEGYIDPLTLIPTDLIEDTSQAKFSIGYRFITKGTYNKDVIILKIPRGTSTIRYKDFDYSVSAFYGLKDIIREVPGGEYYELIQDTYCMITNSNQDMFLDGNMPTGYSELIVSQLDINSEGYIPAYFDMISKLDHPLTFDGMVTNLVNKKSWIPVTDKSQRIETNISVSYVAGKTYRYRGIDYLCLNDVIKTNSNFDKDPNFLQL